LQRKITELKHLNNANNLTCCSFEGAWRKNKMERAELKDFVDDLRVEWKDLWRTRLDDKVRAEGIAKQDYSRLFVEQGTVIKATRDYKHLEFFDIVQDYLGHDAQKAVPPNSTVGGWGKFIRSNIRNQKTTRASRYVPPKRTHKKGQQQKKGGRGWRHAGILLR
jgi:hypothetical protein